MAKADYTAEDYTAMAEADYREYHQRLAERLRSAAEHSTTKAIKARLIAEAEQHERIVRDVDNFSNPALSRSGCSAAGRSGAPSVGPPNSR